MPGGVKGTKKVNSAKKGHLMDGSWPCDKCHLKDKGCQWRMCVPFRAWFHAEWHEVRVKFGKENDDAES